MPYFPPQQTALDILNKIKTVDGSGSGLDADTVDGLHANELSTVATLNDLTDVIITSPSTNQLLQYNGTNWVNATVSLGEGGGVTDHGALTGLSDDDHSQYLLATGSRTGATSSRQVFTSGITTGSMRPSSDTTTAIQLQKADGTAVVTVDTTNNGVRIGSLATGENAYIGVDAVDTTPRFGIIKLSGGVAKIRTTTDFVVQKMSGGDILSGSATTIFSASSTATTLSGDVTMNGNLQLSLNDPGFVSFDYGFPGRCGFIKIPGSVAAFAYAAADFKFQFASAGNISNTASGQTYNTMFVLKTDMNAYFVNSLGIGNVTSPTALLDLAASTTTRASLRIRSGTAPSSPNDGDIWFDGTHLYCRIAGVTKQLDN